MAGGIKITPYQPLGVHTPAVPGGGYQQIDTRGVDFGQSLGIGLQQAGAELKQVGREVQAEIDKRQALEDETTATHVSLQYRQRVSQIMADPEKGYLAARGQDALDRAKDTQEALRKAYDESVVQAQNPRQKLMLEKVLGGQLDGAIGSLNDHALRQRAIYQDATFSAQRDTARAAGIRADNDQGFMREQLASEQAERARLTAAGMGEDVVTNEVRKLRGTAFKGRLAQIMDRDPDAAAMWYAKNRGGFNPEDTDEIELRLKTSRDRSEVQRFAASFQSGGPFNVGNIRAPQGGFQSYASREDAVAAVVRNARAYPGSFNGGQAMPLWDPAIDGEAARRGFEKVKANQQLTPDEKEAYDRARRTIAGRWAPYADGKNDSANWAAYVSRVGGLDMYKPLDLSDPKTASAFAEGVHAIEFGRDAHYDRSVYEAGAAKALGRAALTPRTTLAVDQPRLGDFIARVDTEVPVGSDPERRARLMSIAQTEYARAVALWTDKRNGAIKDAHDWIVANPGKSFAEMPEEKVLALDSDARTALRDFSQKAGKPVPDDEVYYKLHRLATSEDANVRRQFASENLMLVRAHLADDKFERLVSLQGDIRKGDPDANIVGLRSLREMQDDTLRATLKLDPAPKPGSDAAKDVALFRRRVDEEVDIATRDKGRKLTPQEQQAIVDRQAMTVNTGDSGLFSSGKVDRYKLAVGDIPRDLRASWDKALQGARTQDVTDDTRVAMFAALRASPTLQAKPDEIPAIVADLLKRGVPVRESSILNSWNTRLRRLESMPLPVEPLRYPGARNVAPTPPPTPPAQETWLQGVRRRNPYRFDQ